MSNCSFGGNALAEWIPFADVSPGRKRSGGIAGNGNETTLYFQKNQPQRERLGLTTTRASLFWLGLRVWSMLLAVFVALFACQADC